MNTHEDLLNNDEMCSFYEDDIENMCSNKEYDTCGDGCVDVKNTELNTKKGLKIKDFRELEVFFRLSDFFVFGGCCPGENEG